MCGSGAVVCTWSLLIRWAQRARYQAKTPLIALFRFPRPALITIYGNGKQVRDVLFVDDLVRALRLASDRIDMAAGEVFNIGGGPSNTISVWSEFGELVTELAGRNISVNFDGWRPGDQPCYVSDIRKASDLLGWRPLIDKETGVRRLWEWASSNLDNPQKEQSNQTRRC